MSESSVADGDLYFEESFDSAPNPLRVILPIASVSTVAVLVAVFFAMDVPWFIWAVTLPGVVLADAAVFYVIYRLGRKPPQIIRVTDDAVFVAYDGIRQVRVPTRDIQSVGTRVVMGETQVVVSHPAIVDSGSSVGHTIIRSTRPEELVATIEWAMSGTRAESGVAKSPATSR